MIFQLLKIHNCVKDKHFCNDGRSDMMISGVLLGVIVLFYAKWPVTLQTKHNGPVTPSGGMDVCVSVHL